MARSFPLPASQFADRLLIRSVSWTLQESISSSGYGSGEPLDVELSPAVWTADVQLGIRHFNYAAKYGYLGYAKGGFDSDNNVDWSPLYVARMYSWPAFMGMMDQVAEFWGFPPFPTDD